MAGRPQEKVASEPWLEEVTESQVGRTKALGCMARPHVPGRPQFLLEVMAGVSVAWQQEASPDTHGGGCRVGVGELGPLPQAMLEGLVSWSRDDGGRLGGGRGGHWWSGRGDKGEQVPGWLWDQRIADPGAQRATGTGGGELGGEGAAELLVLKGEITEPGLREGGKEDGWRQDALKLAQIGQQGLVLQGWGGREA